MEVERQDLEQAELFLIKEVQQRHFAKELQQLQGIQVTTPTSRGHVAPKSKSLRPHNPFIDPTGLLRVGSRLIHANIAVEQKFPIILPPKDDVTISIARSNHISLHHTGPKHTLESIRGKFWINRGLQVVKTVINHCVSCQKNFKRPLTQKMAPLPNFRVTAAAPFERTAVDLAGPFDVKMNSRATHKVWISLFTCCVTCAVHTELVYKMDADSMVKAIIRFSS